MATQFRPDDPLAGIAPEALITDPAECAFYAQDVFTDGPPPLAVFRPGSTDELARGVAKATAQGIAIIPRGGGMSYTKGYVAPEAGALIVDMGRMQRIVEINETDMTVTVEAGCTWHALYEALHPRGLRTPLWGTLSGLYASVGGGMSQNGLFWGGRDGTIAPNIICAEVVLADGSIVKTGSNFLRPFGPDLTGLFGADAGAFGVKATITLPLLHDGEAFAYGSFAFDEPANYCAALSEIGRRGLASEAFGFDPFLQAQRMKRDSLASDAKSLVNMVKSQGGFWKGLKEGAKVVAAGRSFLDDCKFSIHLICEGRSQAAVNADMAAVEAIVTANGGRIVENTIPKILRANPFPPPNSMAGPEGERWAPVHGIVRHSKALETIEALTEMFDANGIEMERLGVGAGYMFLVVGRTGFLIEPCFYWPDEQWEIHRRFIDDAHFAKLPVHPRNDEARALVEKLRQGVIDIFGRMEGIHFQIGRTYPLKSRSDPRGWAILEAVKANVDPKDLMNPGALGL
ncbi:MAG: FAD-binding oxidoreductase [Sphingomonadaceae bacterium]|nr:FAD-binding oxidoreductase [Sphingomonadaceae bacterium]